MTHTVIFDKADTSSEMRLAKLVAQLIREGVAYTISADQFSYEVHLTGGF